MSERGSGEMDGTSNGRSRRRLGVGGRLLLGALLTALTLGGCSAVEDLSGATVGSGTAATQERTVGTFDAVRSSASIQVDITVGPAGSVQVRADDNLLSNLVTEVQGSTLSVSWTGSVSQRSPAVVTVTMPELTSLEAESSSEITATGVSAASLMVAASSSARITASGTADGLDLGAASSAEVDLSGLVAQQATVDLSSSARATVHVVGPVSGGVASSATLVLVGQPASVNVATSSSGTVVQK